EVGIGITALMASAALLNGRSWIALHLPQTRTFAADLGIQLFSTMLLIGVPVFLMGGTLPVILNAIERWTPPRKVVAQLYGLNTLGAACGTLAAGFLLIWVLGLTLTVVLAIALNLGIGVVAWTIGSHLLRGEAESANPAAPEPLSAASAAERALWLALAFVS